ncbi:glycosyltransferase family 39 protein [Methanothrix soehngenii]|jgi:hypothetical protein|uniref:glycosyltransferase family 39 protein n=1 Tax=Methanothrix soehngenii TaxID=2223 RepID=UPI003141F1D9
MMRAIYLLAIFLLVYNINLSIIDNGDSVPASLLPFNILENHNLTLDYFSEYFDTIPVPWMVKKSGCHLLSVYPIVTPVLVTPLYIIPYLIIKVAHYPMDPLNPGFWLIVDILEKIAASIVAALSGVFIYLAARKLIRERAAIVTAIFFAFGTNTWATSSQQLWQHGLSELILAMLLYIIFSNNNTKKDLLAMGALSGLFVFNRPADSILLLPILYYVLKSDNRLYYAVGCATGLPFAAYNLYYFGSIMGGMEILFGGLNIYNIGNALGLLVSPNRGILIYSPIVVLAVFGYFKSKRDPFYNLMVLSILAEIAIYGSFVMWSSGGSYGPRFMTGMFPYIAIFMGLYINTLSMEKNKLAILCMSILFAWSVFVQIIGVAYPYWLWAQAANIDTARAWDWHDMEIFTGFYAGPKEIHPIEGLKSFLAYCTHQTPG